MCFTSLQFVNVFNLLTKTVSRIKSTLISFKFANKDSTIRKTSWKFHMHYVNTAFHFFGELSFREGKVCCYWIIIFLCMVIKMKFYRFIATVLGFFFLLLLKGKILKKLVVALKFLTVLTLNCNIFC